MENFFITIKSWANAIENLKKGKIGQPDGQELLARLLHLTGYNKVALVGMFRDELNTGLACKLVEIGEMNKGLILEEWYLKVVEFEKAR